jgi:DNA modification methylase
LRLSESGKQRVPEVSSPTASAFRNGNGPKPLSPIETIYPARKEIHMRKQLLPKKELEDTIRALKLVIVYVLTEALRPDLKNPRSHPESQIKALAKSIAAFGFIIPIVIDAVGVIIAGHARWLAAKLLGLKEVPTIQVSHLTPAQRRAFTITDNRLTELSEWDQPLLAESLKVLALEADFDMEVLGFELPEIDILIQDANGKIHEIDTADEVPASCGPAISRVGDLYNLGSNRILCDDAQNPACYQRLMGSTAAALVFADAPFNVRINHHASTARGKTRHREFVMASGEMAPEDYAKFLVTVFMLLARYSEPGSLHYHCIDWRHLAEMLAAGKNSYSELKNLCVWVKPNGGMGALYRSRHELVLVFKSGDAPHDNNVRLGRFGRNRTNVWDYPSPSAFGRPVDKDDTHGIHPTTKPVALIADILLDASRRGDIVLDPFLGSGSSIIAAERTGRRCYGLELDPLYVDAAIRRWEAHTGKTAFHESGASFAETVKQREGGI